MHSTPLDLAKSTFLDSTHTAVDVLVITPGATILSRPVRRIRSSKAQTITITTFAGNSVVLQFTAGETRFIGATHVTASSDGTAIIEGEC